MRFFSGSRRLNPRRNAPLSSWVAQDRSGNPPDWRPDRFFRMTDTWMYYAIGSIWNLVWSKRIINAEKWRWPILRQNLDHPNLEANGPHRDWVDNTYTCWLWSFDCDLFLIFRTSTLELLFSVFFSKNHLTVRLLWVNHYSVVQSMSTCLLL